MSRVPFGLSYGLPGQGDSARDGYLEPCPACRGRGRDRRGRFCGRCGSRGWVPRPSRADIEADKGDRDYHERSL